MLGHACLALNRNNESVALFLSLADAKDRQAWLAWAEDFARGRGQDCVAAEYLLGDALARLGRLREATARYDSALRLQPDFQLALVGRATAMAASYQLDRDPENLERARTYLDTATSLSAPLAEAFAALGNLQLLRHAPEGATNSFAQAMGRSTDSTNFAMALNGMGCALYGLAEWEAAASSFRPAAQVLPLPLFVGNMHALALAVDNMGTGEKTDSPRFRYTDILAWAAFRAEVAKPGSVLRAFASQELPVNLDSGVLALLNQRLQATAFYPKVRSRLGAFKPPQSNPGTTDDFELLNR